MANPTIKVEVKTIGARRAAKELDNITVSARRAAKAQEAMVNKAARQKLQLVKVSEALKTLDQRLRQAGAGSKAPELLGTVAKQLKSVEKAAQTGTLSVQQLTKKMEAIAKTTGRSNRAMRSWAKSARDAEKSVLVLRNKVNKLTTSTIGYTKKTGKAAEKAKDFKLKMSELARSASLALGPLNGVAARITAFSGLVGTANIKIAGLIGALVGIGGLIFAAKKTANAIDEMRKSAETIGLSVSAFQELSFAASQGGVRVENFTSAMESFSRRLGDVRGRTGQAADAFRILFGELSGIEELSVEQAFLATADAIKRIEDPALRASIAADLFNRRNIRMVKVLEQGASGIELLRKQARELGIVFEDEVAAQATLTTDRLDQMGRVISINLQKAIVPFISLLEKLSIVIVRLAPQIQKLSSAIVPLGTSLFGLLIGGVLGKKGRIVGALAGLFSGVIIQNADNYSKKLTEIIKKLEAVSSTSSIEDASFRNSFVGVLKLARSFLNIFAVTDEEVKTLRGSLTSLEALELKGPRKAIEDFNRGLQDSIKNVELLLKGDTLNIDLNNATNKVDTFLRGIPLAQQRELAKDAGFITTDRPGKSIGDVSSLRGNLINKQLTSDSTKNIEKSFTGARTALEKFNDETLRLKLIQFNLKQGGIEGFSDSTGRAAEAITRNLEKIRREYLNTTEGFKFIEKEFRSFGNTLADVFRGAETPLNAFRSFLKKVVDDLIDSILRLKVINPILNEIFDLNSKESGGGGFGTSFFGSILKVFSGKIDGGAAGAGVGAGGTGLGFAAHGASASANQPFIVGEQGPELFVPKGAGNIIPNGVGVGGGVTFVQQINISPGTAEAVRREITALRPMLQADAIRAVAAARGRGGNLGRALGN